MKSIKYRGKEAVMVNAVADRERGYVFMTFVQKQDFGLTLIKWDFDTLFEVSVVKEFGITNHDLDSIDLFRKNMIGAEELGERIQLAQ